MPRSRLNFLLAVLIATTAATTLTLTHRAAHAAPPDDKFILVVHGGAGDWSAPEERLDVARAAITKAAQTGYATLSRGGSSLDAVEATLRAMEDSGIFDAGRGGYYTQDGVPELDAAIMDGRTLNAGAVASLRHIANPISLARLVMEKTPHVMLVGDGAERFAKSQGVDLVAPFYFYNERFWKLYLDRKEKEEKKSSDIPSEKTFGTVGAVALDQSGNLAAGTSTGGTNWKMPGRVGDSPIIGAGTYANNDSCGISGTGVGEFFMRNTVASDICARVRYLHISLEQAADDVVMKELVAQKGEGGIIGLDRQGHVATPFNTQGMIRATVRADGQITVKIVHE
jgi:L-asparaginase / beta-aspartyl-peptidase